MEVNYERQTLDHPNPLARFAHRTRFAHSIGAVIAGLAGRGGNQRLLDFGCGQGRFLKELHGRLDEDGRARVTLMGYDPYMASRFPSYQIVSSIAEIAPGSVDILTCFEVCEHLDEGETMGFIACAREKVVNGGLLLVSVPIMAGPALAIKEFARALLFRRWPDTNPIQLCSASLLGVLPPRAKNIMGSHRGYDWKVTRDKLRAEFGNVETQFLPFRSLSWYGNSQAFMTVRIGARES